VEFNAQKRSLYVFDWQVLRVNLNFSTTPSTDESLRKCWEYVVVKDFTAASLYKVINLCAATVMSLEGQKTRANGRDLSVYQDLTNRIRSIQVVREELGTIYRKKSKKPEQFAIDQQDRLAALNKAEDKDLLDIHKDLHRRWTVALERPYHIRRPELKEYLLMLEMELSYRGIKINSAFRVVS
jgi:hypothetical protein